MHLHQVFSATENTPDMARLNLPYQGYCVKATPHKDRLTALWHICLHIFRHLAHKFLDIRQYACEIYVQSAEKSDCASVPQSLCGVALNDIQGFELFVGENFHMRKGVSCITHFPQSVKLHLIDNVTVTVILADVE